MSATNSSGEAMLPSFMRLLTVLYHHSSASTATRGRERRAGQSRAQQVGSCAFAHGRGHIYRRRADRKAPGTGDRRAAPRGGPAGALSHAHAPQVHRARDDGVVVIQTQFDSVDWLHKDPRLLHISKRTRYPSVGRAESSGPLPRSSPALAAQRTVPAPAPAPAGRPAVPARICESPCTSCPIPFCSCLWGRVPLPLLPTSSTYT